MSRFLRYTGTAVIPPCSIGEVTAERKTNPFQSSASSLGLLPLAAFKVISGSKPQHISGSQLLFHLLDFHSSMTRIALPLPHLILHSITSFSSFSFELCGATNVYNSVLSILYRQYGDQSSQSKPTGTYLNGVTTPVGLRVLM